MDCGIARHGGTCRFWLLPFGQGRRVRFFRFTELITLLLEAKEERQLLRLRLGGLLKHYYRKAA